MPNSSSGWPIRMMTRRQIEEAMRLEAKLGDALKFIVLMRNLAPELLQLALERVEALERVATVHDDRGDREVNEWPWPNFTREELTCKCGCGLCLMDDDFMDALQALRLDYARPMPVTSGYRCPAHNCAVSDTGEDGPHTTGRAVDVSVRRGSDAYDLVGLAMAHGFNGIGVGNGFLHLDQLDWAERPNLWSY